MSFSKVFRSKDKDKAEVEEFLGLFPLTPESPSKPYNIDIIAIHGLGGHYKRTWTQNNGEEAKLWLQDFLPSQLQSDPADKDISARIFSYGYDSAVVFTKATTGINQEARILLNRLKGRREQKDEVKRPIILIAHSLGGLLAKRTMIYAWQRSELYGELGASIRGIVFLGVPHRGSDIAFWAAPPVTLLKALSFGFLGSNKNLKLLEKDSEELGKLSDEWSDRSKSLTIKTFHEQNKYGNIVVVPEASAFLNLHNEERITLAGSDHVTMCRFSDATSQRYEPVWKAVRNLVREALSKPNSTSNDEITCMAIQKLSVIMENKSTKQEVLIERNTKEMQDFERTLNRVCAQLPTSIASIVSNQSTHSLLESTDVIPSNPVAVLSRSYQLIRPDHSQRSNLTNSIEGVDPDALITKGLRVHISQHRVGRCLLGCECACHQISRFQSPQILDGIIGRLFIGYSGIPMLSRCDYRGCQRLTGPRLKLEYSFPSRWLSQAIHVTFSNVLRVGPDLHLKTYRLVDGLGAALYSVKIGNRARISQYLENGDIMINDYDEHGNSLLSEAIRSRQYEIASYLLRFHGAERADIYLGKYHHECPMDVAWHLVHEAEDFPRDIGRRGKMYSLFSNQWTDYCEDQYYSEYHLIILGFDGTDLVKVINRSPYKVNDVDARGRTALIWAAIKRNVSAVRILLEDGKADPNIHDLSGSAALHYACNTVDLPQFLDNPDSLEIIRLLIVFQANLEARSLSGSTPLHLAGPNVSGMKYLLKAKADVQAVDNEGKKPIHTTAVNGFTATLALLINNGADIESVDDTGRTPLYCSMSHNQVGNTQWLISLGARVTGAFDGSLFLHKLAAIGNKAMIEMLTESKLKGIDVNAKNRDGHAARFYVIYRAKSLTWNPFPGMIETWGKLEQSIVTANALVEEVDDEASDDKTSERLGTGNEIQQKGSERDEDEDEYFHDAQESI